MGSFLPMMLSLNEFVFSSQHAVCGKLHAKFSMDCSASGLSSEIAIALLFLWKASHPPSNLSRDSIFI